MSNEDNSLNEKHLFNNPFGLTEAQLAQADKLRQRDRFDKAFEELMHHVKPLPEDLFSRGEALRALGTAQQTALEARQSMENPDDTSTL